ncbi:uncharacterized protein B0P05DRAFT_586648 [Gilbertella persicaria]|uniref:uncharacterized protein n=1 Tax=Gilbertella persicaria TaxID=101096 RepID=UPI00221EA385|nr:uncharacterized protein B0P05DRAFT_586648 [Gilbertella persicaria]KAI8080777.1 hypothetical protein B0P05DRAFT_586648 [Gilbertella persicaria]
MATLLLLGFMISKSIPQKKKSCQTFSDIYDVAECLFQQGNYTEAYRVFYELGETFHYQQASCAWYQIQCLLALGHWRQVIMSCHRQLERHPYQQKWRYIACETYLERKDYTLAWEEIKHTDNAARKRIVYEGLLSQHNQRNDILDYLTFDLASEVFKYLDLASLARCTCVSKRWRYFLISNAYLWNDLELTNRKLGHIWIHTLHTYLNRLHTVPLTRLVIEHQKIHGEQLLTALVNHQCQKLKTLILTDVICTPTLFFHALEYIGSVLHKLEWTGSSVQLNDLIKILPKTSQQLKHLAIKNCFTAYCESGPSFEDLEAYGETLPSSFVSGGNSFHALDSLELSSIHGLKTTHLAHILSQCSHISRLVLDHCLVDIVPVINMIRTTCPCLTQFCYARNQLCQQYDAMYRPRRQQRQQRQFHDHLPWTELRIHFTSAFTNPMLQDILFDSAATLNVLDLYGSAFISDNAFGDQRLTGLKELSLGECYSLSTRCIVQLIDQNPLLEKVNLSGLTAIHDIVLVSLSCCEYLHTLNLSNCHLNVTHEAYKQFIDRRRHSLRQIDLQDSILSKDLLLYTMIKLKTHII